LGLSHFIIIVYQMILIPYSYLACTNLQFMPCFKKNKRNFGLCAIKLKTLILLNCTAPTVEQAQNRVDYVVCGIKQFLVCVRRFPILWSWSFAFVIAFYTVVWTVNQFCLLFFVFRW